jgi:NADH-quinone oxidoreductase subunit G
VAAENMVVSTTDEEAQDFRRHVIEWLMINHPHDCPVCDEGGHCLLQDETVSGGHGVRRFLGDKRTYPDQYLGELVQHEMNRCIQCYRCARFYREYAGYNDLGTMGIASRIYFGRFEPGVLESPFSGNLIDICPTGVYTDRPARFKARRWDLERAPSVCLHCSLGCNTTGNARYREMIRQESRENPKVNGFFICDRGRYGFGYANHDNRPRQARVDGSPVSFHKAVTIAAARIDRISRAAGPGAVGVLGSARNSLETQVLLNYICHQKKWTPPHFFTDPDRETAAKTAARRLDRRISATLADLEQSDCIIAVGVDPLNEAPMLALAMRQAFRKKAPITVLDPRPVSLPCAFEHLAIGIDALSQALAALTKSAVSLRGGPALTPAAEEAYHSLPGVTVLADPLCDRIQELAAVLARSRRPVIVCGGHIVPAALPGLAADLAFLLGEAGIDARLFYVLSGPNGFGAGLFSQAPRTFESTLQAIADGEIKILLAVENDPLFYFPDRQRLTRALGKLEFLMVLDYLPSAIGEAAHIMLPTTTVFESGGSFVNNCGRLQYAPPVHFGGMPLSRDSKGSHPPHLFRDSPPGREFASAYQTLLELAEAVSLHPLGGEGSPWTLLPGNFSGRAELWQGACPDDGIDLLPPANEEPIRLNQYELPRPAAVGADFEFRVLAVESLFGTEELSRYAAVIQQLAAPPQVFMHRDDGHRLGLADKGRLRLRHGEEELEFSVRLVENMAPGHLIAPRNHELFAKVGGRPLTLPAADFTIIDH